ncbi:MAG TPA: hypothetical protein VHZ04_03565 [Candidatus Paceibacterota bacterium]|jgi:hypothetical protein|nr:hypothetical protein [Candidatus Paceibacterota bacterium]
MAETPHTSPKVALDPLGSLLGNAWKHFKGQFWMFVAIFAAPAVVISVGRAFLTAGAAAAGPRSFLALGGLIMLVGYIIAIVATIALILALGRKTDFGASYHKGFQLFWPMIWIVILCMLVVGGGSVLLIIPGIFLGVALSVTNFAFVLDDVHGMAALRTSREYTRGYWWALFGRIVLMAVVIIVIMLVVYVPFAVLTPAVVSGSVYAIAFLLVTVYSTCYTFTIYENLKRLRPDAAARAAERAAKGGDAFMKVCMVIGIVFGAFFLISFAVSGRSWVAAYRAQMMNNYPAGAPGTNGGGPGSVSMGGMPMEGLTPSSGPVGTQVMIMFPQGAAGDTFTVLMNSLVAAKGLAYASGDMMEFAVPSNLAPDCKPNQACPQFMALTSPQTYSVSVLINDEGNPIPVGSFTVTK